MTVRKRVSLCSLLGAFLALNASAGAQPAPLTDARRLYNEGRYGEAVEMAESAPAVAADAEVSRLIAARARLERFRETPQAEDLDRARSSLVAIDPARLSPRDQVEMQIGLGMALFLEGSHGAAAEVFAAGYERTGDLASGAGDPLLDWWASAMDRAAQGGGLEQRTATYARLEEAMRRVAERDPASPVAAYWVAAAARARGDAEAAWQAALAAWVRAPFTRGGGAVLRPDLDRLVTEALVPERARKQAALPDEVDQASADLLAEWERFKVRWTPGR